MNARPRTNRLSTSLRRLPAIVALWALVPALAAACIWDTDTLRQERSKFPEALELITGKFLRHSPEFYQWRIQDRLAKLKTDPNNLDYHDDLAVAYSKVGRTNDAVAVMKAKEKLKPGLYETYSNLGTFYVLAGEFDKGLPYIDKALAINPDAHFGRERYQKWLVEWALTCKQVDGKLVFPLVGAKESFVAYIEKQNEKLPSDARSKSLNADALKGVLGMMRFADHDNPLLLEALAPLMLDHRNGGQRLASRAYLLASYRMKDVAARDEYRKRAQNVLSSQEAGVRTLTDGYPNIEDDFRAELADADRWYAALKAEELRWIREGKDVEAEFDKLYSAAPSVPNLQASDPRSLNFRVRRLSWPRTIGLVLGSFGIVAALVVYRRRRKEAIV